MIAHCLCNVCIRDTSLVNSHSSLYCTHAQCHTCTGIQIGFDTSWCFIVLVTQISELLSIHVDLTLNSLPSSLGSVLYRDDSNVAIIVAVPVVVVLSLYDH